jgi:hypothetical protein
MEPVAASVPVRVGGEVRRSGRLVFDRMPVFRKKFEIQGRKSYEDFLYLHNRYVNAVLYGSRYG